MMNVVVCMCLIYLILNFESFLGDEDVCYNERVSEEKEKRRDFRFFNFTGVNLIYFYVCIMFPPRYIDNIELVNLSLNTRRIHKS